MMNPVQESAAKITGICSNLGIYTHLAMKDEMDNILWPQWSELGLLSRVVRPVVITKEGEMNYPMDQYSIVTRVINKELLNDEGEVDAYAWDKQTFEKKRKSAVAIGCHSIKGWINLIKLLKALLKKEDKKELFRFFRMMPIDLLLVTTVAEYRQVYEVTPEMYEAGVTECVNDWESVKSGWTVTKIEIGDFLVVTDKGMYVIRRKEFFATHSTFETCLPNLPIM